MTNRGLKFSFPFTWSFRLSWMQDHWGQGFADTDSGAAETYRDTPNHNEHNLFPVNASAGRRHLTYWISKCWIISATPQKTPNACSICSQLWGTQQDSTSQIAWAKDFPCSGKVTCMCCMGQLKSKRRPHASVAAPLRPRTNAPTACASMVATSCKNTHPKTTWHRTSLVYWVLNSSDLIGVMASAAARGKTRFPSLSNELVSPLIESSGDLAGVTESMVDVLSQIDSKPLGQMLPKLTSKSSLSKWDWSATSIVCKETCNKCENISI